MYQNLRPKTQSEKKDEHVQFIERIMTAIGKSKKFDEELKFEFAKTILAELGASCSIGLNIEDQPVILRTMRKKIKAASSAFENLFDYSAKHLDTSYIDSLARQQIWKCHEVNIGAESIKEYLKILSSILEKTNPIKRKPGRKNYGAQSIARMIALQYYKSFGVFPSSGQYNETGGRKSASSGSGERQITKTPFDRVCIEAGKLAGIEIRPETRRKAVDFVKNKFRSQ